MLITDIVKEYFFKILAVQVLRDIALCKKVTENYQNKYLIYRVESYNQKTFTTTSIVLKGLETVWFIFCRYLFSLVVVRNETQCLEGNYTIIRRAKGRMVNIILN